MPSLLCTCSVAAAVIAGMATSASAQQQTITYQLINAWLLPDISAPWIHDPQPMTGTFEWTYTPGDFENGTGQMTSIDLPWWSEGAGPSLSANMDTSSIEITMNGNYHELGVDVSIFYLRQLSPDEPAGIDLARSMFNIEMAVSYQGHFLSGSLIPTTPDSCIPDLNNDGTLDFFDASAFLAAFAAQNPIADLTGDGAFDFFDVAAFLDAFAAGCP